MFLIIRKKVLYAMTGLLALVLLMSVLPQQPTAKTANAPLVVSGIVVIDPGHGGEDGGTVAADGTTESQINLAVAMRLREIFFLAGIETVMTREADISIYTEGETVRARKVSDLNNRVHIVNSIPNAVLISIHQNSLPQAKSVHGAQVFCNANEGSELMAELIQAGLNMSINTDRAKEKRKIDTSVYLMNHIDCPSVLVECGFLSNEHDTALLKTTNHQNKIALTVAAGYLVWCAGGEQE